MKSHRKGPAKATGVGGTLWLKEGREGKREFTGRRQDIFLPDVSHHANWAPDIKGSKAYCTSCHAIYDLKHWHLDEAEFARLSADPEVESLICPSCRAIERGDFYGELHLRMDGLEHFRAQILNIAYNEERRARAKNPHERIGRLIDRGNEIEIDTIGPFLIRRISHELEKAIKGTDVHSDYAPGKVYVRAIWGKAEAIEHIKPKEARKAPGT